MTRAIAHLSIVESAGEIAEDEWMRTKDGPGALFGDRQWYRLAEHAGTAFAYVVLRSTARTALGGTLPNLLGVLPVFAQPPSEGSAYDQSDVLAALQSAAGASKLSAYTVAGSWNSNLLTPMVQAFDEAERGAVWRDLLDGALAVATTRGAEIVVAPFLEATDARSLAALQDERILLTRARPTAWAELAGRTFDDYLAGVSRNARSVIRREERRFANAGLEIRVQTLRDVVDAMIPLLAQNRAKYGRGTDRDALRSIHLAQADVLGDEATISVCAYKRAKLVGVVNLIVWRSTIHARSFGLDYTAAGASTEYFNLSYYLPIRLAYERGLNWIYAGPGAYHVKASRGFRIVPLWTAILLCRPASASEKAAARTFNRNIVDSWHQQKLSLTAVGKVADW